MNSSVNQWQDSAPAEDDIPTLNDIIKSAPPMPPLHQELVQELSMELKQVLQTHMHMLLEQTLQSVVHQHSRDLYKRIEEHVEKRLPAIVAASQRSAGK